MDAGADLRVLDESATIPDLDSDETGPRWSLSGLHAKLYAVERAKEAHVFIGSANATGAAWRGNDEVLVEIVGRPKAYGVAAALATGGESGFGGILLPHVLGTPPQADPDEDLQRQLEQALREVAALTFTATVEISPEAPPTLWVQTVEAVPEITAGSGVAQLSVTLMTLIGRAHQPQVHAPLDHRWQLSDVEEITPFLVLRLAAGSGAHRVEVSSVVLARLIGDPEDRLDRVLARHIGSTSAFVWNRNLSRLDDPERAPDPSVTRSFRDALGSEQVMADLLDLVDDVSGRRYFSDEHRRRSRKIIGQLRHLLARVSVGCLEPDLVILDEFQRFKHLLDAPDEGAEHEVSQLAHDLFTAPKVKVLLLSATPYKMFTLAEERHSGGDDHYTDFFATFEFLANPYHAASVPLLKSALSDFRRKVVTGDDPRVAKQQVETLLRRVMCRTERPVAGVADMLKECDERPPAPSADDLVGFTAMKRIATEVNGALSVEYWKSAPYFLNFMDGYQLSEKFRHHPFDSSFR
jgi:hypothetical protein